MSFIVNPISMRLGFSKFWRSLWYPCYLQNYAYLSIVDSYIFNYIKFFSETCKQLSLRKTIINTLYGSLADICIVRRNKFISILVCLRTQTPFKKNWKKKLTKSYSWKNIFNNNFFEKYLIYCISLRYKKKKILYSLIVKILYIFLLYYTITYKINISFKLQLWKYLYFFYILQKKFQFFRFYFTYIIKKYFFKNMILKWHFILWPMEKLSASLILSYIIIKLHQKFYIRTILNQLLFRLKCAMDLYKIEIIGIKICISGRFTRRERKLWWWKSFGEIGYSSISKHLDYASGQTILLNSICGIKVWINKGWAKKPIYSIELYG